MDVVDGLVRQRATPAAPVLEEFAIQVVDMFDAQRTFRDVADAWVDVVVDHPPVAMRGARTDCGRRRGIHCSDRNLPNVNGDVDTSGGASASAASAVAIASASARDRPAGCQRRRSRPLSGSMPS